MKKSYCPMCDEMVAGNPCPKCGADTERWPVGAEPLEPAEPVFRGREASAFDLEKSAQIMREIKR